MNIVCLKNTESEGLGLISNWVRANGHHALEIACYDYAPLPTIGSFDLLVVCGGPMGVNDIDEHPWLVREKAFIREGIEAGKIILGICLGAQLIAHILGAEVKKSPNIEIGWMPVTQRPSNSLEGPFVHLPMTFDVLHWHGDMFDLPKGAKLLASSEGCHNQAFIYGSRIVGLQFHIELTEQSIEELSRSWLPDPNKYIQSREDICAFEERLAGMEDVMNRIMDEIETMSSRSLPLKR